MIKICPATLRKLTLLCSFLLMTIATQAQMEFETLETTIDTKEIVITKSVRTFNTAPIIFKDNGTAVLLNGRAEIEISAEIATLIDGKKVEEMIQLSIQMEGDSNGVYISKKNRNTFIISELDNGVSNTPFSYNLSLQAAE